MKILLRTTLVVATAFLALLALSPAHMILARTDHDPALLDADHALLQLLGKGDTASHSDNLALNGLLDDDFSWIDSNGRSLRKPQVLKEFPTPANANVDVQVRTYGRAAVIRANHGQTQVLRVWIRRDSAWRLVLYQEVTQVEKSEPPPAAEGGSGECDNPCKTIPFQPDTPSEGEAIISWQGVMRAMANNDAAAYSPLIADEFTATDTHHDRPYTKADRLAQINKQNLSGARSFPPALLSARMFDFGDTVMMIAREQRANAKAYFNTRMWVKRDGRWQMLFSFNTRIE
jgi:hypothetical protein